MFVTKLVQLPPVISLVVTLDVDAWGITWGVELGWLGCKLGGSDGLCGSSD